jgi:hypothetical protein
MASVYPEHPAQERRMGLRRASDRAAAGAGIPVLRDTAEGMRVSWGGVWGGVLVGMGILILLAALGLAVGITAVEPGQTQAQTVGMGAGIWAGVSLLIALFVGGMVATRIGMVHDRATGVFEGMLVWVITILLMVYLAGTGIAMLAGGAFRLVGGAAETIGTVVGTTEVDLSAGSVDQIARRLRDPQTARTLAAATGMQESEIQSQLSQIADRAEAARDNPAQAAAEVRQGVQQLMQRARAEGGLAAAAQRVQPEASATAWITFAALVLSMIAAVLGAMLGRRRAALLVGRE